jgi:hypothetical protein
MLIVTTGVDKIKAIHRIWTPTSYIQEKEMKFDWK